MKFNTKKIFADYTIVNNYKELKNFYPHIAETLASKYNTNNLWSKNKIYIFPTYEDYGIYEYQSNLFYQHENIIIDKNFTGLIPDNNVNYAQVGREIAKQRRYYDIEIQPKTTVIIHVTYPFNIENERNLTC